MTTLFDIANEMESRAFEVLDMLEEHPGEFRAQVRELLGLLQESYDDAFDELYGPLQFIVFALRYVGETEMADAIDKEADKIWATR